MCVRARRMGGIATGAVSQLGTADRSPLSNSDLVEPPFFADLFVPNLARTRRQNSFRRNLSTVDEARHVGQWAGCCTSLLYLWRRARRTRCGAPVIDGDQGATIFVVIGDWPICPEQCDEQRLGLSRIASGVAQLAGLASGSASTAGRIWCRVMQVECGPR